MNKGDIVLVPFPFTNLKGTKRRPAVVLYQGNEDILVCFITSRTAWREEIDLLIQPNRFNGLKKASLVKTDKIATLENKLIVGKIGKLENEDIEELDEKLKMVFKLN